MINRNNLLFILTATLNGLLISGYVSVSLLNDMSLYVQLILGGSVGFILSLLLIKLFPSEINWGDPEDHI